jgi:hypothetical protein
MGKVLDNLQQIDEEKEATRRQRALMGDHMNRRGIPTQPPAQTPWGDFFGNIKESLTYRPPASFEEYLSNAGNIMKEDWDMMITGYDAEGNKVPDSLRMMYFLMPGGGKGLASKEGGGVLANMLGSFSGLERKGVSVATFEAAKKMKAAGATREEIWDAKKVWQDPADQQWKEWIPDDPMIADWVDQPPPSILQRTNAPDEAFTKLDDILADDALEDGYPDIMRGRVFTDAQVGKGSGGGGYTPQRGGVGLTTIDAPLNHPVFRENILHETYGHAKQDAAGFGAGSAPDMFKPRRYADPDWAVTKTQLKRRLRIIKAFEKKGIDTRDIESRMSGQLKEGGRFEVLGFGMKDGSDVLYTDLDLPLSALKNDLTAPKGRYWTSKEVDQTLKWADAQSSNPAIRMDNYLLTSGEVHARLNTYIDSLPKNAWDEKYPWEHIDDMLTSEGYPGIDQSKLLINPGSGTGKPYVNAKTGGGAKMASAMVADSLQSGADSAKIPVGSGGGASPSGGVPNGVPQPLHPYSETGPPALSKKPNAKGKHWLEKVQTPEEEALLKRLGASQRDIDAGNYTPYFDVSKRTDVNKAKYEMGGSTQTDALPKTLKKFEEQAELANSPATRKRLREVYKEGETIENAEDWYFVGQLEAKFIKQLGAKEGRKQFDRKFATAMAATTAKSSPKANFRSAMYGNYLSENKIPYPQNSYDVPSPVGGFSVIKNLEQHKKFVDEGIAMDVAGNPKRFNFRSNFLGDENAATLDEQMASVLHPGKSELKGNYRPNEAAVIDEAAKAETNARRMQEVAWAGIKKNKMEAKGQVYPGSKPMIQEVNESIERTAREFGMTPEEVVIEGIINSRMPMYAKTGAGAKIGSTVLADSLSGGGQTPMASSASGGDAKISATMMQQMLQEQELDQRIKDNAWLARGGT